MANSRVLDGSTRERVAFHRAFGDIRAFSDGVNNFTRLAKTITGATLTVAYDDQCVKAEVTTSLNHFGDAIDEDNLLDQ